MQHPLIGIAIPVTFRSTKMSPARYRIDRDTGQRIVLRPPERRTETMNLYFAPNPVAIGDIDLLEPGTIADKNRDFYLKHNAYGDHQFLVPVKTQPIEKYEAPHGMRFASGMIGNDPTTAVYQENLQLLPCSQDNLELFLDKLQSQPFYISITDSRFVLHIKNAAGGYLAFHSHRYSPSCWAGFAHPVITLQSKVGSRHVHRLSDIHWSAIADELSSRPLAA